MTKKQYGGKLLKTIAIFGVPLVALMWISSASGGDKKPKSEPDPRPDDLVPPELKKALDNWIGNSEASEAKPPVHVAWYYAGWWIAVQVYPDTVEISEESNLLLGPMAKTITYRARFRWLVMLTTDAPLAVGDVTGEGSASSIAPSEDTIDEARREAAQIAANAAGEWLEAFRKSKK